MPATAIRTSRLHQLVLILGTLAFSWLAMQAVHEFGHVCGVWLTGGRVERVVLHPLMFSRTDVAANPRPLQVVWAGPLLGVILPVILWLVAAGVRLPGSFVLRFFAGFCLVANGVYIGVGSFARVGDCAVMLRQGSQMRQLWLFGVLTAPLGLALWNRQGVYFGFGAARGNVRRDVTYAVIAAVAAIVVAELALFHT